MCPKDAGGDGKTDDYADCPEGTSGYYAQQAATGHGGAVNTVLGLGAACGESSTCESLAGAAAAITGFGLISDLFAAEKLDHTASDRAAGLRKMVEIHRQRLADYIRDPDAADNKGFLKNASPELREKIIQSRIRNLEDQIKNFENQIDKMLGGGQ